MKLWRHQKEAVDFAMERSGAIFDIPTGAGKTWIELAIMQKLGGRWVVVTKKTIIPSWIRGTIKYRNKVKNSEMMHKIATISKDYDYKKYYKNMVESWAIKPAKLKKDLKLQVLIFASIIVVNPEIFHKYQDLFSRQGRNLIIDESDIVCNPDSRISKYTLKHSRSCKYKYLLSGTPWDGPFQIFSPVQVVDGGARLGSNYWKFKKKYGKRDYVMEKIIAAKVGRRTTQYKPADDAMIKIKTKINDLLFSRTKSDVLPELPPLQEIDIYGKSKKAIGDGGWRDILVRNGKLDKTQLMACRTLASGFVYQDGDYLEIHKDKVELLQDLVDELKGHKLLIWVHFDGEEKLIEKYLDRDKIILHNYKNTELAVNDFVNSAKDVALIAKPAALGRGVDGLQNVCNKQIWFSASYEARAYRQATDRLHRAGQDDNVQVFRLIMEKTIEPEIYYCIENKLNFADYIRQGG